MSRIKDSSEFQRLDAAGNDTKSLERLLSTAIGPQSDHTPACLVQRVERSLFSATLCCVLNNLSDFRWPPKYLRSRERHENRGWKPWVQNQGGSHGLTEGVAAQHSETSLKSAFDSFYLGQERARSY